MRLTILILILSFVFHAPIRAQEYKARSEKKDLLRITETSFLKAERYPYLVQGNGREELFRTVQHGVASGEIESLSRHFGANVYLNIRGAESGYFSANQAHYVLQNFFNQHKPVSFSFTSYGESGGSPYATGRGSINVKGNREFIQIYVSLARFKDRWIIGQFNIY
jgi:hypothetical protein